MHTNYTAQHNVGLEQVRPGKIGKHISEHAGQAILQESVCVLQYCMPCSVMLRHNRLMPAKTLMLDLL